MPAVPQLCRTSGGSRKRSSARTTRPLRLAALAATAVVSVASVFHRPILQATPSEEVALGPRDINALDYALTQVQNLRAQVDAGQVVPNFGDKARSIVNGMRNRAPALEETVDKALHALFLRQAAILTQQVAQRFEQETPSVDVLRAADEQLVSEASALLRPGADWSLEGERAALSARLHGAFQRESSLLEEKARAAQLQQVTVDVIGRLQYQMDLLQQKAQGAGSNKSPWVLSTSYRIPNSPFQLVGKYEQGRADIELNLSPEKDPSTSEGGFAQGVGPANLGVSFNVGF